MSTQRIGEVKFVALRRAAPRSVAQRLYEVCTIGDVHSTRFTGGVVAARQPLPLKMP
jgi:hypothetical protein